MQKDMVDNPWIKYPLLYLIVIIGSGLYMLTNHMRLFKPSQLSLTPIDNFIPFIPETIFVYVAIFILILIMPFLITDGIVFRRTILAGFLLLIFNIMIFVFFPTEYSARPDVAVTMGQDHWLYFAYKALHEADTESNCFPSMHVSIVTYITLITYKVKPRLFKVLCVFAFFIILSTLTTKQHYLWDVLGGVLLAVSIFAISLRDFPYKYSGLHVI
ncbi:hypothetical protein COT97_03080 [Candidatus Falkowbacteria bacterium CG10_big_fil_rev_8_21_14_0_10_39_11]|uniref:Inositolphosphotransferase Aur1/Ipt1 domain-containing protein n=1 Tax=Candidatus Falkowbacteria bacterium CG10_big_fil_rev_8_21_14_0_10_39_11 TaxID=1974565 RepID=A0A2H0V4V8_9BACT|nr:MAG: hypothetical protein COT97_03080 [Candidatus Falkowbacteria bacterium CG10_big_fil_rev_8_21_14_0_10_39_11]